MEQPVATVAPEGSWFSPRIITYITEGIKSVGYFGGIIYEGSVLLVNVGILVLLFEILKRE